MLQKQESVGNDDKDAHDGKLSSAASSAATPARTPRPRASPLRGLGSLSVRGGESASLSEGAEEEDASAVCATADAETAGGAGTEPPFTSATHPRDPPDATPPQAAKRKASPSGPQRRPARGVPFSKPAAEQGAKPKKSRSGASGTSASTATQEDPGVAADGASRFRHNVVPPGGGVCVEKKWPSKRKLPFDETAPSGKRGSVSPTGEPGKESGVEDNPGEGTSQGASASHRGAGAAAPLSAGERTETPGGASQTNVGIAGFHRGRPAAAPLRYAHAALATVLKAVMAYQEAQRTCLRNMLTAVQKMSYMTENMTLLRYEMMLAMRSLQRGWDAAESRPAEERTDQAHAKEDVDSDQLEGLRSGDTVDPETAQVPCPSAATAPESQPRCGSLPATIASQAGDSGASAGSHGAASGSVGAPQASTALGIAHSAVDLVAAQSAATVAPTLTSEAQSISPCTPTASPGASQASAACGRADKLPPGSTTTPVVCLSPTTTSASPSHAQGSGTPLGPSQECSASSSARTSSFMSRGASVLSHSPVTTPASHLHAQGPGTSGDFPRAPLAPPGAFRATAAFVSAGTSSPRPERPLFRPFSLTQAPPVASPAGGSPNVTTSWSYEGGLACRSSATIIETRRPHMRQAASFSGGDIALQPISNYAAVPSTSSGTPGVTSGEEVSLFTAAPERPVETIIMDSSKRARAPDGSASTSAGAGRALAAGHSAASGSSRPGMSASSAEQLLPAWGHSLSSTTGPATASGAPLAVVSSSGLSVIQTTGHFAVGAPGYPASAGSYPGAPWYPGWWPYSGSAFHPVGPWGSYHVRTQAPYMRPRHSPETQAYVFQPLFPAAADGVAPSPSDVSPGSGGGQTPFSGMRTISPGLGHGSASSSPPFGAAAPPIYWATASDTSSSESALGGQAAGDGHAGFRPVAGPLSAARQLDFDHPGASAEGSAWLERLRAAYAGRPGAGPLDAALPNQQVPSGSLAEPSAEAGELDAEGPTRRGYSAPAPGHGHAAE